MYVPGIQIPMAAFFRRKSLSILSGNAMKTYVGMSVLALALAPASFSQVKPDLYAGMKWRNIGPFRGGRVSAVSGSITEPGVFYAASSLGGVWKTVSAGVTWFNVTDSIPEIANVTSIAVAPSDLAKSRPSGKSWGLRYPGGPA